MTEKRSCLIPRSSSMFHIDHPPTHDPSPAVDARLATRLTLHQAAYPVRMNCRASATDPTSYQTVGDEVSGDEFQFSEQYMTPTQDGVSEDGLQAGQEMESGLLPPSEPSPLAVHIGLYSVLNEPEIFREGLLVDTDASKEFHLLQGSSIYQSAANHEDLEPIPGASFLDACFICKRRLGQGLDTYMYRGEVAFCSIECRQHQILMEEQQKNCSRISSTRSCISGHPRHERNVLTNNAAMA